MYIQQNCGLRLSLSESLNPNFKVWIQQFAQRNRFTFWLKSVLKRPNFSSAKGSATG